MMFEKIETEPNSFDFLIAGYDILFLGISILFYLFLLWFIEKVLINSRFL